MAQEAVKSGMDMRREAVAMRSALKVFPAASNPEGFAKAVKACNRAEAEAVKQIRIDAAEAAKEVKAREKAAEK